MARTQTSKRYMDWDSSKPLTERIKSIVNEAPDLFEALAADDPALIKQS